MPAPSTPTNRRLQHSRGHEPSSSLQSSPLPDASEISPASSGALSPQSSSSGRHSSPRDHHHTPERVLRSVRIGLHNDPNNDDFPLVSREPSRGPSKSSLRSVDPTSMHAKLGTTNEPRALHSTRRPLHTSDRRGAAAIVAHASSTASSRSPLSHRSASSESTLASRPFLNDAAKQQHLVECRRRERLSEAQRLWAQQVANKRKYNQPELEKKERSALNHRLFNLKVRQLRQQDGSIGAIHSELISPQGTPTSTRVHQRDGHRRLVSPHGPSRRDDDDGAAQPTGIAFNELLQYLFDDYVHVIVPQQLTWIGQSGERGRSDVPPMMQLVSHCDPSVVLGGARCADGGGRTPRGGDSAHRHRGPHQGKGDDAREMQEAKWFQAAQRQFKR